MSAVLNDSHLEDPGCLVPSLLIPTSQSLPSSTIRTLGFWIIWSIHHQAPFSSMSYIRKPLRISPDANVADFRSLTEFLRAENWARQYFDDVEKERSAVDLAWEEHVLFMGQEEHDGDVRQDNSWAMPSSTPEAPEEKEARQQDEKPCVESSVHVSNTVTTEEDGPRSVVLQHSEIELCQQSQTMLPLDEARAEMMRGIEDHHFTLAQMSDLGPMFQELERTPPRGREKTARSKKRQRSQVGTSPEPDRSAKRPRHDAYSAVHLLHNSTNVHQVQNDSDSLTLMLNDVASVPQHDDSILTTTPYPSKSSSLTPPCPDQYLNDYPDISLPSSTPPIPVLKRRNRLASRRGRRDFIIHEDKTAQPARDER